jgi:ribosomal protein S18 acetylase RimI-like enzyme
MTTNKPYQPADLERFFDILRARPARRALAFPSFADLREILAEPCQALLWLDMAGQPVGFSILMEGETYASLVFEVRGEDRAVYNEILQWGQRTCARVYHGESPDLSANALDEQSERIAALRGAGFDLLPEEVHYYERDLHRPIPEPQLPAGYRLRQLAGEGEVEDWVALHRAAFGTENMTPAFKRAMMALPDYDPRLDLVAVAPNGQLAAYVNASIDREANALAGLKTGFTDPVATHPNHQRRGLARALLLAQMAALKARGMDTARLATENENLAMRAAAQVGRGLRYAWIIRRETTP